MRRPRPATTTRADGFRAFRVVAGLTLIVACTPAITRAQPFYFGNDRPRATTAAMIGYTSIDFAYVGEDSPAARLDFSAPAITALYSRANFSATLSYGTQNAADTSRLDLGYLDGTLMSWAEIFFSEAATDANHRIFVPVTLYMNFRRVSPRDIDILDDFSITTLGLGVGLGYYGQLAQNALLEVRVTPAIGVALQSFSDSAGSARLADADVQLHLGPFINRFGLSLGYNYRVKRWNVGGSSVFVTRSADLFDYHEQRHTVTLGINW
ncbi:MAG: hypothetical protein R2834_16040 [Rhodothermales bacterium]